MILNDSDGTGGTNAKQSKDHDDKDADAAVLDCQSINTCRLSGIKSHSPERDNTEQQLVGNVDGCQPVSYTHLTLPTNREV